MSDDSGAAPITQQRFNKINRRQLPSSKGEVQESSGGGTGAGRQEPQHVKQQEKTNRPSWKNRMAEESITIPHISRSQSVRANPRSRDLDLSTMPFFDFTPLDSSDFNISDNIDAPWNDSHKISLSEEIARLGIDALPYPENSNGNDFSADVNAERENSKVNQGSTSSQQNSGPHAVTTAHNSRHKQRARSEPAGPRKAFTFSDDIPFEGLIGKGMKTQMLPEVDNESTEPEAAFSVKPIMESDVGIIPDITLEPDGILQKFGDTNILMYSYNDQKLSASDSVRKSKGRSKKHKHPVPETMAVPVPVLTTNTESLVSQMKTPETQAGLTAEEHRVTSSSSQQCSFTIGDSTPEQPKSPQSPKKSPGKTTGTSSPPTVTTEVKTSDGISPPKQRSSGGGEGSNHSIRPCKTSPDKEKPMTTPPEPPKVSEERRHSPPSDKLCHIRISKPCVRRRLSAQCCRIQYKGSLFKCIAQAVGCQLNCIANRNQQFHHFPGMQGLYTPDIGLDSLFYPQDEDYEICDDLQEPALSMDSRSSPKRHGTPAFYNNRGHSVESIRSRDTRKSSKKGKVEARQSNQGRRFMSVSERHTSQGSRQSVARSDRQRGPDTKRPTPAAEREITASRSSNTSVEDDILENSQSSELRREPSRVQERQPVSRSKMKEDDESSKLTDKVSRTERKHSAQEIEKKHSTHDTERKQSVRDPDSIHHLEKTLSALESERTHSLHDPERKHRDEPSQGLVSTDDEEHPIGSRGSLRTSEKKSSHESRSSRKRSESEMEQQADTSDRHGKTSSRGSLLGSEARSLTGDKESVRSFGKREVVGQHEDEELKITSATHTGSKGEEEEKSQSQMHSLAGSKRSLQDVPRSVSSEEKYSAAELRKSITESESRRSSKTRFQDISQERIPAPAASVKEGKDESIPERSVSCRDSIKSLKRDVLSEEGSKVGDCLQNVAITVKCDQPSNLKSPSSNCIQLETSMCSPVVVLNVLDCRQVHSFSEQHESTDTESVGTKKKKAVAPSEKGPPCKHLTGDFDRRGDELYRSPREVCAHLRCATDRSPSPCDAIMKRHFPRDNESPVRMKRSFEHSFSNLSPCHRRHSNQDQTTPDMPINSRYTYGRSTSSKLPGDCPCNKSDMEHRKKRQAANTSYDNRLAYDRTSRDCREDALNLSMSRSSDRQGLERARANGEDPRELTGDTSDYDTLNERSGRRHTQRINDFEKRDRNIPSDRRAHAGQKPQLSGNDDDEREEWGEDRSDRRRATSEMPPKMPSSSSSSSSTDMSSLRMTVTSCIENGSKTKGKRSRTFRDVPQADDNRETQSLMTSPHTSRIHESQGYQEREDSRRSKDAYKDHGKRQHGFSHVAHSMDHPSIDSHDDSKTMRLSDREQTSDSDVKHPTKHQHGKKMYDRVYEFGNEDASTSVSKQLDMNLQKRSGSARERHAWDERGESLSIKSVRERSFYNKEYDNTNERRSHSERLSFRQEKGRKESIRDRGWEEKQPIHLKPYPSPDRMHDRSDTAVKGTSSKSPHSIASRDSHVFERKSSMRESLEHKGSCDSKDTGRRRRKYSQHSHSTSMDQTTIEDSQGEDSENTLPASPGDLESEYIDDETDERTKACKHSSRSHRLCSESEYRKSQGRLLMQRSESQDESHNSSSCRAIPAVVKQCRSRKITYPQDRDSAGLNSHSVVIMTHEKQNCESFLSDTCADRYDSKTHPTRTRQLNRSIAAKCQNVHDYSSKEDDCPSRMQETRFLTKSPKFHYVRSPKAQRGERNEQRDYHRSPAAAGSRSNSANHVYRVRVYREGTIDLFKQIITPEQPLQLHERRYMHSIKNGVPFYCNSLGSPIEKQDSSCRGGSLPPAGVEDSMSAGDDCNCRKETIVDTQSCPRTKRDVDQTTDAPLESQSHNSRPSSAGGCHFTSLSNAQYQRGHDNTRNPTSGHRSSTRSATGVLQPAQNNRQTLALPTKCPDFEESEYWYDGLSPRPGSGIDPASEDTDYSEDLAVATDVVAWTGNKNFSSSAERDRNSSSGHGDNWYHEYAYRCGVIDTLKLLDNNMTVSTSTAEIIHPCQPFQQASESCIQQLDVEDHLSYLVKSIPSLTLSKHRDEAFEIIRQNSLRALLFAATLSVDWPASQDNQSSNLENLDLSSISDMSSFVDVCDLDSNREHLKSAMKIKLENGQDHSQSKKLKYTNTAGSTCSRVAFKDTSEDGQNNSSSEAVYRPTQIAYARLNQEDVEKSGSSTFTGDSESHQQSEALSSLVSAGESHASSEIREESNHLNRQDSSSKTTETTTSMSTEASFEAVQARTCNNTEDKGDSYNMPLRKATLSHAEEKRLRAAISKKIGYSQNFKLVPVSLAQSDTSTDKSSFVQICHSPEKKIKMPSGDVLKRQIRFQEDGSADSNADVIDVFDTYLDTSQGPRMTFFVVALGKQQESDEMGNGERCAYVSSNESLACTYPSDAEGKSKKYYIFTRDELIRTVKRFKSQNCESVSLLNVVNQQQHPTRTDDQSENVISKFLSGNTNQDSTSNRIQAQPVIAAERDRKADQCYNLVYRTESEPERNASKQWCHAHQRRTHQCKVEENDEPKYEIISPDGRNQSPSLQNLDAQSRVGGTYTDIKVAENEMNNHRIKSFSCRPSVKKYRNQEKEPGVADSVVQKHSICGDEEARSHGEPLFSPQIKINTFGNENVTKEMYKPQKSGGENGQECLSELSYLNKVLSEYHPIKSREEGHVVQTTELQETSKVGANNAGFITCETKIEEKLLVQPENYSKPNVTADCLRIMPHNRSSSSDVLSSLGKPFRRTKSSSDIDSKTARSEKVTNKRDKKRNQSHEKDSMKLLDNLADGKIKVYIEKAHEKWTSPSHTICFRLTQDNKSDERKTKNEPLHDFRRDINSSLSSEEYQYTSSQSVTSVTDPMTERSTTEESVVILSLPAKSNNRRKKKTSSELAKVQNENLLHWITNSAFEMSKSKTQDVPTEKYVISIKRKRLVSEARGQRKNRRRLSKNTPSSDSGNITNSANDNYDAEPSTLNYGGKASRSRHDLPNYNRKLKTSESPGTDINDSPVKGIAGATSRRRGSARKSARHTETGNIPSGRSLSIPRRARSKKRAASAPRRIRTKKTTSQKSPKGRNYGKTKEVATESVCKESKELQSHSNKKCVKTFTTSGISRIARALNTFQKSQFNDLHSNVTSQQTRWQYTGPVLTDPKKPDIPSSTAPEKVNRARISDEDSLEECGGFESCLLTPIKEESQSQGNTCSDKSKSEFDAFVNKCRLKLMEIKDGPFKHQNGSRCIHKHGIGNSCSSVSVRQISTSSGNFASREESDISDNRTASCLKQQKTSCRSHNNRDFDCDYSPVEPSRITSQSFFSYLQNIESFKSAFLRKELHGRRHEARSTEDPLCRKEEELLKLYASGTSSSNYLFNSRSDPTPSWPIRNRNVNITWRITEADRKPLLLDKPLYARSLPEVSSHKTRHPATSASQIKDCFALSSTYKPFRCDYGSAYLNTVSPQVTDMPNMFTAKTRSARGECRSSRDECRSSNGVANRWYSVDSIDFGSSQHDLIRRNWNESANNGSDGSSSGDTSGNDENEMRDSDLRAEYLRVGQLKAKLQTGDAPAASNDRSESDKPQRETRAGHMTHDQYFKQSQQVAINDPHYLCRDHACMSYDFVHQNYKVARVSNFAARNINGSGNMFGRGMHPSDEHQAVIQENDGDSEEEFTSATEDFPLYSTACKKRPKRTRKSAQEMDDTCNHPDSVSYYMGDGPSGQFDNFEGIHEDDLLISLSPVDDDGQVVYCTHRQKNAACQRSSSEAAGQASACMSKPGRSECELHGHIGVAHQLEKNHVLGGRSCFGQGDILNKRIFTQWYVDEEKGQQSQRRSTVNAVPNDKCAHRELWITPSENCDSSGDEGEEDEEDDDNDCDDEDEDGEENEDEEGEDIEGEDEEDDDDDEEDDEDEDEDGNCDVPARESSDGHRILLQKSGCPEHTKEKNSQNNYQHEKPQDMNESKMISKRVHDVDTSGKRPAKARAMTQAKRYATGNKPGHQQSTGDHLAKQKIGTQDKNMHIKATAGHQHKFSLDQIKVPAIEKERVRFACDENGDWAEIGRGSYGCVYLGLLDGIVEVAIKDFYESSSWDLVIHEARMLMFLQDTGITPKFYGLRRRFDVSKQPSEYCIIMEYFGDGRTLFNVMSDKMALGGDEWMDIVGQLVAGLRLIHRKNVLINDLKADNILIDLTGGRKIIRYIDVGMATYKQGLTFQLPQDQMSKYNFLAPEVREGARTTTRSDIYSLGYMLEQMCRMADTALGGLKKLVARCMEKNPARRPDIDDIVSQVHRFIASKASIMITSNSPREQFVLTNSV